MMISSTVLYSPLDRVIGEMLLDMEENDVSFVVSVTLNLHRNSLVEDSVDVLPRQGTLLSHNAQEQS